MVRCVLFRFDADLFEDNPGGKADPVPFAFQFRFHRKAGVGEIGEPEQPHELPFNGGVLPGHDGKEGTVGPPCNHQKVAFRRTLCNKVAGKIQPVLPPHDTAFFPCLLAGVVPRQETIIGDRGVVLVGQVEKPGRESHLSGRFPKNRAQRFNTVELVLVRPDDISLDGAQAL